jgi:hypothetical protein
MRSSQVRAILTFQNPCYRYSIRPDWGWQFAENSPYYGL